MGDAALFFGGDAEFLARIVLQTLLENQEHLVCGLACGADDVDVAEFSRILAVGFRQRETCFFICRASSGLLLPRPLARVLRLKTLRLFLADLWMTTESFQPILRIERPPDGVSRREKLLKIMKGALCRHAPRPEGRAAALQEFRFGFSLRKIIQLL
ncbi:MAG: hypothetical protein QOH25_1974 [Acidobacteriota bacterium]|nr:hypothetical protein [Acidobacteriota bacterium]